MLDDIAARIAATTPEPDAAGENANVQPAAPAPDPTDAVAITLADKAASNPLDAAMRVQFYLRAQACSSSGPPFRLS